MTVPVLQTQSRESVSELTHYGGERFHDHLQVGYGDDGHPTTDDGDNSSAVKGGFSFNSANASKKRTYSEENP
jgi:hypothetical protein